MKPFLLFLAIPPLLLVLAHIPYVSTTYFEDGHLDASTAYRGIKRHGLHETYYHDSSGIEQHTQRMAVRTQAFYEDGEIVGDVTLFTFSGTPYREGTLAQTLWEVRELSWCGNDRMQIADEARYGENWDSLSELDKSRIVALELLIKHRSYARMSDLDGWRVATLSNSQDNQARDIYSLASIAREILLYNRPEDFPRFSLAQLSYLNSISLIPIDIAEIAGLGLVI